MTDYGELHSKNQRKHKKLSITNRIMWTTIYRVNIANRIEINGSKIQNVAVRQADRKSHSSIWVNTMVFGQMHHLDDVLNQRVSIVRTNIYAIMTSL